MDPQKPYILIVDDIRANIQMLEEYLRDDYVLKTADCGEDALEIATAAPFPDLILLDVMMPGISGYQVLETLKQNPDTRHVPVIFVTSRNEEEEEEKGFALGAVDYVIKPYKPAIVKSRIRTQLELKRYRDSLEHLVRERTADLEQAYEELKTLDMAREKVVDHLAHELKTPLAVLKSVFDMLEKEVGEDFGNRLEKAISRGARSVRKLLEIQEETEDICQEREIHIENINLNRFLADLIAETDGHAKARNIKLVPTFAPDCGIEIDKTILAKACRGLLKNAIENTPDEGEINIELARRDGKIRVRFRDYGVGITEQSKKQIFGGFYHTQDTNRYSTKKPYMFDAGGTGADLLRTKIFAQQCGFEINFSSERCRFISEGKHRCRGVISECRFVRDRSECLNSGGSVFELVFQEPG